MLTGAFASGAAGFATWMRAANRELPERIGPGDLALMTVATHKAARPLAKDRVTSTVRVPFTRFEGDARPGEVSAAARGRGRITSVLTAHLESDVLHIAYKKAENST